MSDLSLNELIQKHPERYTQLEELIYIQAARGLDGFYVMEKISNEEEVILEIAPSEQGAREIRNTQIFDELRRFDTLYYQQCDPSLRWRATASLEFALKKAAAARRRDAV